MIRGRIASFGYAFEGLAVMIRTQPNAWIHARGAASPDQTPTSGIATAVRPAR